jgi:bifunctional non-homologous end joining protein LigD
MAQQLEKYKQKRDFQRTGEPQGAEEAAFSDGLRYVIQHHMARREHYDFRLEWQGVLLSWAIPKGPSFVPGEKRLAVMVEDHPLDYRNFEGTIPKGEYGGGTVMLWDEGFWEPEGDPAQGLEKGRLKFTLKGARLKGKWALIRTAHKNGDKDNWLLLKEKDEHALDEPGIAEYTASIRTGRTMAEIEAGAPVKLAGNPFDKADVQLARLAAAPPEGQGWIYEIKYDGYRAIAYIEQGQARIISRNGTDLSHRFGGITASLASFFAGRAAVLDGELVMANEQGKTDFQALQNYMRRKGKGELIYVIFDILGLDGVDLRAEPLSRRKDILKDLLKGAPAELYFSPPLAGVGAQVLEAACFMGLEGIIAKRADSPYKGARNADWLKIKCDNRQEFVIGGYTLSDKKARGISSLLLGVYKEEELHYIGRAGSGISEGAADTLLKKLIPQAQSPFILAPKPGKGETFVWTEPEVVAEIKFNSFTEDNLLRQASYKGIREDKEAKEVRLEQADAPITPDKGKAEPQKSKVSGNVIEGIKVSSPDKIIFAERNIKKIDIVSYYSKAAQFMLPYMENRLLSIVRCPKGTGEPCFFKKHPAPGSKEITSFTLTSGGGKQEEYFYINSVKGIVEEAQMGTIEFHLWGSRTDKPEQPDLMVFDLDPDEGMDLDKVRQGVLDLKSVLDKLSLTSFLKTSGGKGYHIVLPFQTSPDWEAFSLFARKTAEIMEAMWPERYTSNMRKEKRKGKIFIDWVRNGRGATSVSPYSLRAKEGASVSMPIGWEELNTVAPAGVSMENALLRLSSPDPWADFFSVRQKIKPI